MSNQDNQVVSLSIPFECLSNFKERVEKANKRTDKIGCERIEILSVSKPKIRKYQEYGYHFVINECIVEISKPNIIIEGWKIVGRISRDRAGAIAIMNLGLNDFNNYTEVDFTRCDHCHTKHKRSHLAILANDDNEEMVVGKACLKDFLGISPSALYTYQDTIEELEDTSSYRSSGEYYMPSLEDVVALTFQIATKYGYVKASEMDDNLNPTYVDVLSSMKKHRVIENEYRAVAKKVINFIRDDFSGNNEYNYNLKQVFDNENIVLKKIALVCSVFPTYHRALKEAIRVSEKNNEYVGIVGNSIEIEVSIINKAPVSGAWGNSMRFDLEDNEGNSLVCFTTSKKFMPDINDKINIKAKVKKHEVFRNRKQTQLKNIKIA